MNSILEIVVINIAGLPSNGLSDDFLSSRHPETVIPIRGFFDLMLTTADFVQQGNELVQVFSDPCSNHQSTQHISVIDDREKACLCENPHDICLLIFCADFWEPLCADFSGVPDKQQDAYGGGGTVYRSPARTFSKPNSIILYAAIIALLMKQ